MPEDKAMEEPKEVLNTASQIKINRPAYLRRWNERFRTREAQYRASKSSQSTEWLNYSSLHYAERSYKWDYISDHLTGAVLDEDRIERYLLQRSQGESQDYYAERAELAAYTPDFARACIVLGGKVFESETGVNRTWTRPIVDAEGNEIAQDISLGDPADMASPVHTFWQNVDGNGSHYDTFLKSLAINLVAYGEMWVMLQGWDGDNAPCLRLIEPQYVLKDCYDKNGLLESVKVRSFFDAGSSGQSVKSKAEERFTIFYADYYQVWRYNDKGKPEQVGEDTAYSESGFAYEDKQGNPVPPIFKVKMPYETCIGYLLAKKANVLFNHQNSLDMLLHVSCFPRLAADTISNTGEINKQKMRDIEDAILAGSTIIHGKGSQYISPSMEPAKVKSEIIKEYRREFYRTAFQTYNDHAAQKTATEMRQDWSMSVQSFLSSFAYVMEDADNCILHRLEQAYLPENSERWGLATATWDKDFTNVEDPMDKINAFLDRILPGTVPVDVDTIVHAICGYASAYGYDVSSDEQKQQIRERVEASLERQSQSNSLLSDYGSE